MAKQPDPIFTTPAELEAWRHLASDTHDGLARAAEVCVAKTQVLGAENWSPPAVAVRLLLRTCGTLRAVIELAQQGMVAESRTLARNLIEGAFAAGALAEEPVGYIKQLQADFQKSRRNQMEFIQQHMPNRVDPTKLRRAIASIDKSAKLISPGKLAKGGPLTQLYLSYQRLSDDAAHVTARSLERHLVLEHGGWRYRFEPGSPTENAATLRVAVHAALCVGVGVTEVARVPDSKAVLAELADRLSSMPAVAPI
ncbi:DUF5677 domain-containing protein [Ralstonia nicotianae]